MINSQLDGFAAFTAKNDTSVTSVGCKKARLSAFISIKESDGTSSAALAATDTTFSYGAEEALLGGKDFLISCTEGLIDSSNRGSATFPEFINIRSEVLRKPISTSKPAVAVEDGSIGYWGRLSLNLYDLGMEI